MRKFACKLLTCFFFFSSRRRHTRWPRDWSSDVCSSDLSIALDMESDPEHIVRRRVFPLEFTHRPTGLVVNLKCARSEERRVGKYGRSGWSQKECNKNIIRNEFIKLMSVA